MSHIVLVSHLFFVSNPIQVYSFLKQPVGLQYLFGYYEVACGKSFDKCPITLSGR